MCMLSYEMVTKSIISCRICVRWGVASNFLVGQVIVIILPRSGKYDLILGAHFEKFIGLGVQ